MSYRNTLLPALQYIFQKQIFYPGRPSVPRWCASVRPDRQRRRVRPPLHVQPVDPAALRAHVRESSDADGAVGDLQGGGGQRVRPELRGDARLVRSSARLVALPARRRGRLSVRLGRRLHDDGSEGGGAGLRRRRGGCTGRRRRGRRRRGRRSRSELGGRAARAEGGGRGGTRSRRSRGSRGCPRPAAPETWSRGCHSAAGRRAAADAARRAPPA